MPRSHGVIKPSFWTGSTGRALRGHPHAQSLAAYLMTGPHTTMVGIFYLPMVYVVNDLGMPDSAAQEATELLAADGFAERDAATDLVWVPNIARDQVGADMKAGDKRRPALMRLLEPHLKHPFGAAFVHQYGNQYLLDAKGLLGELKPLPSDRKPPYPVPDPVQSPVPDRARPILEAFAAAYTAGTGRREFAKGIDAANAGDVQRLREMRDKCEGDVDDFKRRIAVQMDRDPTFASGCGIGWWATTVMNGAAEVPRTASSKGPAPAPKENTYQPGGTFK